MFQSTFKPKANHSLLSSVYTQLFFSLAIAKVSKSITYFHYHFLESILHTVGWFSTSMIMSNLQTHWRKKPKVLLSLKLQGPPCCRTNASQPWSPALQSLPCTLSEWPTSWFQTSEHTLVLELRTSLSMSVLILNSEE